MAPVDTFEKTGSRRRGRPTLLTEKCETILFDAIERGLPYKQAAAMAGISYDTFNRWRKQGEGFDAPGEFRDFCDRLELAQAKAVDTLLESVRNAARKGDWKAAAWMLERRHPEEWERTERARKEDPLSPFGDLLIGKPAF